MMDFIALPVVVGIITLGIYKLFELFARRKERLHMIDKLPQMSVMGNLELPVRVPDFYAPKLGFSFGALKIGCLLIGLGLGLLVGFLIVSIVFSDSHFTRSLSEIGFDKWKIQEIINTVYGACVLLFGGVGLIMAYLIEKITYKKEVSN